MLGTVQRAGDVLSLFDDQRLEWGPTAVAEELGIAKSRAHELLVSLADIGILARDPSGRYRLGWRTLFLGATVARSSDLQALSNRYMEALSQRFGENVHLAVLDRTSVVFVSTRMGKLPTPETVATLGAESPGHSTAVGKMLLAHMPENEVNVALERTGLRPFTDRTIQSQQQFMNELSHIRADGFAHDMGELIEDLRCVAAPIADDRGVVASMAITTTADRWAEYEHEYKAALRKATTAIGRGMRAAVRERRSMAAPMLAGAPAESAR